MSWHVRMIETIKQPLETLLMTPWKWPIWVILHCKNCTSENFRTEGAHHFFFTFFGFPSLILTIRSYPENFIASRKCKVTPSINTVVGMGDPTLKSEFRDRHFTQPPLAHLGRFYILGFAYDCKLPPRNAKKLNRTCAAPWSPVVSQHWQLTLLVFVQFWWSWRQNVSTRAGKSIGDTFNVPGSKDTWSRD